jgi:glycosyltransferase involved in cell wall biosynthesis
MRRSARVHETDRLRVACLSTAPWNPYLRLLYDAVGAAGVDVVWGGRLSLRWLWRSRRSVRVLHVHWPESLYRFGRGPALLRRPLSWAKLALLALRLAAARALGYRLVWTVHQVRPHETTSRRLDAAGARVVAAFARALIVHDGSTAERVRRELRPARDPVVIPHGSYRGVYPPGRSRDEVARALDVAPGAFVFLCFGELRRYKGIQALLEAFAATGRDDVALIVAGNPKDPATAAALRQAAAADPRIRVRLGFVADDEVAELFELADAVVVARADGGTSGSLILALSLGRPVVAADTGVYRELANGSEPGWTFAPDDARSLREALVRAAGDRDGAAARGRYALEVAERLDWGPIGQATARVFAAV